MELVRNNTYSNDILFIDGFPNAGKSLVARIIEYHKNTEKCMEDEITCIINELYTHNKIPKDSAITILKIRHDRKILEYIMGRKFNMKPYDVSSLFHNPNPLRYFMRMVLHKTNQQCEEWINKNNPLYHTMSQNVIQNYEIYKETFGDRTLFIYILRNPADLITRMYEREFEKGIGKEISNIRLTMSYSGTVIPTHAHKWREKYLQMNDMDKIIYWYHDMMKECFQSYEKYDDEILTIDFDDLVTDTYNECYKITKYIQREPLRRLKWMLHKEKCPRKINVLDRCDNIDFILKKSSEDGYSKFLEMMEIYERWKEKIHSI